MNIHKEPEQIAFEDAKFYGCVRNYNAAYRSEDESLIELAVVQFQVHMLESIGCEMSYYEAEAELEDFRMYGTLNCLHPTSYQDYFER